MRAAVVRSPPSQMARPAAPGVRAAKAARGQLVGRAVQVAAAVVALTRSLAARVAPAALGVLERPWGASAEPVAQRVLATE